MLLQRHTIADLSTIRSGAAAGATAYQKPGTGIPTTDMASGVQTSLGKADSAYQKPSGGIPKTDLESGVQESLELADSAVQADPIGSIVPPVDPSEFATKEEVEGLEAKVDGNTSHWDAPADGRVSRGFRYAPGKYKVKLTLLSGTDTTTWRIYRYVNNAYNSTLLAETELGEAVEIDVPVGDDGFWLFTSSRNNARTYQLDVLPNDSVRYRLDALEKDVVELKEDTSVIPEMSSSLSELNDIVVEEQDLGGIEKTAAHNRIAVWVDDADQPNRSSFEMVVDYTHPNNVNTYRLYKATSGHGSLELIGEYTKGDEVTVEKDADKPSLYIYNGSVEDSSVADFTVNISFSYKNPNSLEARVNALEPDYGTLNGKRILVFGDSITEFKDQNSKRWSDYFAQLTGAEVTNVAIGGTKLRFRGRNITLFDADEEYSVGDYVFYKPSSTMNCYKCIVAHSGAWNDNDFEEVNYSTSGYYLYSSLDIVRMVSACCDILTPIADRFVNQIAAAECINDHLHDNNNSIVAQLPDIDFSEVDAIIIMAGTNDYGDKDTHGTTGEFNEATSLGAVNEIVRMICSTYKDIPIYYFAPVVRWYDYSNGVGQDEKWCDVYVPSSENVTARVFYESLFNEFVLNHIPALSLYETMGWNIYNFSAFFYTDGTHPTYGNGMRDIAMKISSFIISNKRF